MRFANRDEKTEGAVAVLYPATYWTYWIASFMNSTICADVSVSCCEAWPSTNLPTAAGVLCSLWAGGANSDSVMTELPGWDAAACRAPAVNEGLQPAVMINGLALCLYIDFTCSANFSCRFAAVEMGERIKEHGKTIWKSACDIVSCKDHTDVAITQTIFKSSGADLSSSLGAGTKTSCHGPL